MNINSTLFGLAAAATAAILWTLYSAGAFLLLAAEIYISTSYGYTDFGSFDWKSYFARFFLLLVLFSTGAGLVASLIAGIYNFLNDVRAVKLP